MVVLGYVWFKSMSVRGVDTHKIRNLSYPPNKWPGLFIHSSFNIASKLRHIVIIYYKPRDT